jgi:hypothetical protein
MQQLSLLAPRYDSFLSVIRSLWENEIRTILLIGKNDLADKITSSAQQLGITITRVGALEKVGSQKKTIDSSETQVIVFTETSGKLLSAQLLNCVGLDQVIVLAPITDWHFSRRPLFLVSIPKSGTHLLYEFVEALGYRFGGEYHQILQPQTWYFLEFSNSHTMAGDFFIDSGRRMPFGNRQHPFVLTPTLFNFRHPLDILISEAHYNHLDGATPYSGWLSHYDLSERVKILINDNRLLGSLRDRVGGYLPWLEFPNVIPLSYEELVGESGGGNEIDQHRLIWSIQLKLQVPGSPKEFVSQLAKSKSPTFRLGQVGRYIDYLSEATVRDFAAQNSDILEQFGYPLDGSFSLPAQRVTRLHKSISFSKVEFTNVPIVVESDFFGCNLVQYNQRVYALPRSAGPIAIDKLSPGVLAVLPAANSPNELKRILIVGNAALSRRLTMIEKLGCMLKENEAESMFDQFWVRTDFPYLFDTYKHFNIVRFPDHYVAIRQSAGEIDLSMNLDDLVQLHGIDDLLVAHSDFDLCNQIDGLASSQRIRQELLVLQTRQEEYAKVVEERQTRQEEYTQAVEKRLRSELLLEDRSLQQVEKTLKLDQEKLVNRIVEHERKLLSLESNWLIRIAARIAEILRRR